MADTHDPNPETAPEETQDSQQPQTGVKAKAKAATQHPLVRGALLVAAVIALLALVGSMCGDPSGESQDDSTGSSTTSESEKSKDLSTLGRLGALLKVQAVVRIVDMDGGVVMEITMNEAQLHELNIKGEIVSRPSQKWNTDLKQAPNGQRRLHQAVFNNVCPDKADHPQLKALGLCH